MTRWQPTFWQALARREWRSPALLLFAGVIVALGVAAGYTAGSLNAQAGAHAATAAVSLSGPSLATNFVELSAGTLALLAALLLVERAHEDAGGGWLVGLVALGASRRAYVLSLYAVVTSSVIVAFCASMLAFALGAAVGGRPVWNEIMRSSVGGSFNIASLAAYGLGASILTRSRQAAIVAGVAGVALPTALMMVYSVRTRADVPVPLRRLLMLHVPPLSYGAEPGTIAVQVAYAALVLALVAVVANRFVVRQP